MKKIFSLLISLTLVAAAHGQDTKTPFAVTGSPIRDRYAYTNNGLWVDSAVKFIYYRATSDTTLIGIDAAGKAYKVAKTLVQTWAQAGVVIDTFTIATRAWRQKGDDSVAALVALRVKYTDTAAMLANYPAGFSNGVIKSSKNVEADTLLLSTRAWRQKGIDSVFTHGTISGVPLGQNLYTLSLGYGLTGTSYNGTGLVTTTVDSFLYSTKANRQKAVDSLNSLIALKPSGSGTTNYLPKWTNGITLGNSAASDDGTTFTIERNTDINANIVRQLGSLVANAPTFLEFRRYWNGANRYGSIGYLGGTEMNMSNNMDYRGEVHRYYDATKAAIWFYLGNDPTYGGFGIQYTSPNHSNNDSMWTYWGRNIFSVTPILSVGEPVTSGTKVALQQIAMIDGDLSSSHVLIRKQAGVVLFDSATSIQANGLTILGRSNLTAGALTGSNNALKVTATLPSTGNPFGILTQITSSGSTNGVYQTGIENELLAGYSGNGATLTTTNVNLALSTGTDILVSGVGNFSSYNATIGNGTGANVGTLGKAQFGLINYGTVGQATGGKNNGTNIGVAGFGLNTGTTPIQIGGYFGLHSTVPTFTSAALIADNGSQASPIFLARDNGTTVFSIIDGGLVGIGINPTAYLHLRAGTATASTAPVKLTTGTLNTTAEAGTIEYNNAFYQTKNSGLRYGLGGSIYESFADQPNSTTTETDAFSYTTPASTLEANGGKLIGEYTGTLTASGTSLKRLRVYFGGTAIFDSGTFSTAAASNYTVSFRIIRVSATVVRYAVRANVSATGVIGTPTTAQSVGELTGLTLSNTNILKLTQQETGVGAASNSMIGSSAAIFWIPVSSN